MFKRTTFDPFLPNGDPSIVPVFPGESKTANLGGGFPPQVLDFLKGLVPQEGSLYYLDNALGNEEKWGSNRNGDSFPDDQLGHDGKEYGYQTFMELARPFLGHKNGDPEKGFGDIPFAMYDKEMGRVYLIMRIDTNLPHFGEIEEVVRAFEKGDPVATSMGCRVPHDVCSVCGNKAESRAKYCVHAKYYMNETWPDGRRVFVRNIEPRFFDNSLLQTRGADPAAFILAKVASGHGRSMAFMGTSGLSVDLAQDTYDLKKVATLVEGEDKASSADKHSDILKNIPPDDREEAGTVIEAYGPFVDDVLPGLRSLEEPLPEAVIQMLAKEDLGKAASTLHFLGIDPTPSEFQRIGLTRAGQGDLAEKLDKQGVLFGRDALVVAPAVVTGFSPANINWDLAEKLASHPDLMVHRSAHRPFLLERTLKLVEAADEGVLPRPTVPQQIPERSHIPLLAALGGLYFALKRTALGQHRVFQEMGAEFGQRPWALPLIVLGSITVPRLARDIAGPRMVPLVDQDIGVPFAPVIAKHAGLIDKPLFRFGAGLPAAYMMAGHQDTNEYVLGKKPGVLGGIAQDHPAALGIGFGLFGGAAARSARKAMKRMPSMGSKGPAAKLSYLRDSGACQWMPPLPVDEEIIAALRQMVSS